MTAHSASLSVALRDMNAALVDAWQDAFAGEPEVAVSHGPIFDIPADAIVSPANSFGYMDGGIDLVYARHFGIGLEDRLQSLLRDRHFGELPVGQAVIVETGDPSLPYMVSAPTMRVPGSIVRTVNVYLAFRAALIAVTEHNRRFERPIRSLLVPGMGTGVGEVSPRRAARQMKLAYDNIVHGRGVKPRNAGQIWGEHQDLLMEP